MKCRAMSAATFWLLALVSMGCDRAPEPELQAKSAALACACEPPAPVVDATLMAFLSKARALHHQADAAEAQNDRKAALEALEALVNGPLPVAAPEVDEVLADTRARLAELRATEGDFSAALVDVERGLEKAQETGYFRGHLFEVRGLVEEKHAKALEKAGDAPAAEQARRRAIEASREAVQIQDEVIRRAIDADHKERP